MPSAHVAQSVERVLGKDEVGGSNPLVGSEMCIRDSLNIARVAQLVEHHLAKVDVASSNLVSRS